MSIITPMSQRLTRTQWLICIMAAIGFAFDIYEILMLPLIVAPALAALVKATPGTDAYNYWIGVRLWVPAIAGGIFGLLGGYLTDRLGRRRVLTWSILIYAVSAFAAGYSTNIWMFLFFRCTTFIGVCVEFVAAVAWLAEIFTEPKQRERVLGYTQAFSSIGGAMVTAASAWILTHGTSLPAIYGQHESWRYTLMSGLIPALPLIISRPMPPDPAGAAAWRAELGRAKQRVGADVQWWQEIGGLAGRTALAMLLLVIVSRRGLLRLFQVPGLIVVPIVFWFAPGSSVGLLKAGMFFAGFFTVAQFSFWGNYLPR